MRLLSCSPALLLIALAACDDGGSIRDDQQAEAPAVEAPPPLPRMPHKPEPAPIVSKPAEVAIVEVGGQSTRQINDNRLIPLARILEIAQRRVPGQVIEVELDDDDDDGPEYELEILTADGRSIEMKIDARRGVIREVEDD